MRKFEKVGPFCKLYETSFDIKTVNSLDNSGSNEIMQKVLALIVSNEFGGFQKFKNLCLSSDLGEI